MAEQEALGDSLNMDVMIVAVGGWETARETR